MASISVKYNGVDLAEWIVVTDVQRNIGANHTNIMMKVGKSDGQIWQYGSLDSKQITVTGQVLNENLAVLRRELGAALEHDGPAPLIFGDDTNVYYDAITDGQASIAEGWRSGTITISFIVPDGVAHSLTTTKFNNKGEDGLNTDTIVVTNKGSYKAYPVITATMLGDNGLVAFANSQGGALQFGNPEEMDGQIASRNERALDLGFDAEVNGQVYNQGATFYPNYCSNAEWPNKKQGIVEYGNDALSGTAVMPVFQNNQADQGWGGPSLYFPIKANSASKANGNFQLRTRFLFQTSVKSAGRLEYNIQSGNKSVLATVIRDSDMSRDVKMWECWVGDKMIANKTLDSKVLGNQWFEFQISKMGSSITFQLAPVAALNTDNTAKVINPIVVNGTYTLTDSIDGLSAWFEAFQLHEAPKMSITDLQFTWINVDYWSNVINLFKKGDVVTIDTYAKTVMLNGVVDMRLHTVDNDWKDFALNTGDTTIQLLTSSWADLFDCEIEIREAYV